MLIIIRNASMRSWFSTRRSSLVIRNIHLSVSSSVNKHTDLRSGSAPERKKSRSSPSTSPSSLVKIRMNSATATSSKSIRTPKYPFCINSYYPSSSKPFSFNQICRILNGFSRTNISMYKQPWLNKIINEQLKLCIDIGHSLKRKPF